MSVSTDQDENTNEKSSKKGAQSGLPNETAVFPDNKGSSKDPHSESADDQDNDKVGSVLADINGPDSK